MPRPRCLSFLPLVWLTLAPALYAGTLEAPADETSQLPQPTTRPALLSSIMEPRLVTLKLKGALPEQALKELARQSGIDVRSSPRTLWQSREWPRIDLDLQHVSFWKAIREICLASGLQVTGWDRDVVVMAGASRFGLLGDGPVSDTGLTRSVLYRLYRSHMADLQAGTIRRNCTISLYMYIDPQVYILASGTARVESACDELGHAFEIPTYGGYTDRGDAITTWQLSQVLNLSLPPDTGSRMAALKGYVPVVIAEKTEASEFSQVLTMKDVKRNVGPWALSVEPVKAIRPGQSPKMYQVEVSLHARQPQDALPASIDVSRLVQLFDANGVALLRQRYEGKREVSDGQIHTTLIFMQRGYGQEAAGAPARLSVDVPVKIREVALPFEFRDIPLP